MIDRNHPELNINFCPDWKDSSRTQYKYWSGLKGFIEIIENSVNFDHDLYSYGLILSKKFILMHIRYTYSSLVSLKPANYPFSCGNAFTPEFNCQCLVLSSEKNNRIWPNLEGIFDIEAIFVQNACFLRCFGIDSLVPHHHFADRISLRIRCLKKLLVVSCSVSQGLRFEITVFFPPQWHLIGGTSIRATCVSCVTKLFST